MRTNFENIVNEIKEDSEKTCNSICNRIEENAEHARSYATQTRWSQYLNGDITERQLKNYTIKRVEKSSEKKLNAKLNQVNRIAAAPDCNYISICITWSRDHNATAQVITDADEMETGHAGGWGYDKESAAAAAALNSCDSVLKALYQYKESQLKKGLSDENKGTCTGRDNRDIIAYGAGYTAAPYFEGATGIECFIKIFELLGFKCRYKNGGKYTDFYSFTR